MTAAVSPLLLSILINSILRIIIMVTKTQRQAERKYAGFIQLVEGVAQELYTQDEWSKASEDDSGLNIEHLDMLSTVYSTAFQRDPDSFKGIQWINSDYGIPAWVRPGVEWEHDS